MIYLYTGTPGSGKSFHLAKDIILRLKLGKNVIANFDINNKVIGYNAITWKFRNKIKPKLSKIKGSFHYWDFEELTVEKLVQFAKDNHKRAKENQTLLVIDECAIIFNSRAWDNKDRLKWIKFFQQHRKLGYTVILVSQNDRLIDRQIRSFVEYEVKHRKINNFNWVGQIFALFAGGTLFFAITYWYSVREKISTEPIRFNKRIANLYDTYEIFT
ncbi:MAG: zonular occludens toxin domain-containing protein [Sulfolobaceae archaeon]